MISRYTLRLAAFFAGLAAAGPAAGHPGHGFDGNIMHWALEHVVPLALGTAVIAAAAVWYRRRRSVQRERHTKK